MGTEIPDGIAVTLARIFNPPPPPTPPEPCRGTYTAQQVPGAVHIKAEGWHLTGGFRTYFEKSLIAVYPPEFRLVHEAPTDGASQALTPFTVYASFQADEPVESVTIHDADGKHIIEVEQVQDMATRIRESSECCAASGWVRV